MNVDAYHICMRGGGMIKLHWEKWIVGEVKDVVQG